MGMKAKNYFKALRVINSINNNTCDLSHWLITIRRRNIVNNEQYLALVELYLGQKDSQLNQASPKRGNAEMAYKKRGKTRGANLYH
jgi:hypothetical protein